MSIGVVGLGKMGSAIVERLLERGHKVNIWNRTPEKADRLVRMGAILERTPRGVAQAADTVISMLTDPGAIEAVFCGRDGVLEANLSGRLVIDMSTVSADAELRLAGLVQGRGAAFVECPVVGTVAPARTGQLIGLVGGSAEEVTRATPVLTDLCRRIEHVGPVGSGANMKLAINLPLIVFFQALGEAYSLVKHLDKSPEWVVQLLADTPGAAGILRMRGAVVAASLAGNLSEPAAFEVETALKDLDLMLEEARRRSITLPLVAEVRSLYGQAVNDGWAHRDLSTFAAYWGRGENGSSTA